MFYGMVYDGTSHGSTSFQFTPNVPDRFETESKYKPSFRGKCFRLLLLLAVTTVILFFAASVALLLTQKPVDFDNIGGFTYGDAVHANFSPRFHTFPKAAAGVYQTHSISDVMAASPRSPFQNHWLSDDRLVVVQNYQYLLLDTDKKDEPSERRFWIHPDSVRPHDLGKRFIVSSDADYVAIQGSAKMIFRHSRKAPYEIAHLDKGHLSNYVPIGPRASGDEMLQLLEFNPAPGNKDFVFVHENNIYYQADPEKPGSALPVTFSGADFRYHGVSDWIYEEEILETNKALWWARSGKYLAFASFDDRNVSKVLLPFYDRKPHLSYQPVPYPKAGEGNQPAAFLWLWNKELNKTQIISPPNELLRDNPDGYYYLFAADWISLEGTDGLEYDYLVASWANRNQNMVYITVCQYGIPCKLLKKVTFEMNGMTMWAEPKAFRVTQWSRTGFFLILPHEHANGNVYDNVAHIQVTKEGKYLAVSGYHGDTYDVITIKGYDRARDELFFTAAGKQIGDVHVYRVSYASAGDGMAPQCITCLLQGCNEADAHFAPSGTRMLIFCESAYKNAVAYLKHTNNILEHWIVHDGYNGEERQFNPTFDLPQVKFDSFPLPSGIDANVLLYLPPHFNSKNTYPVLLYVYAGPNTVATVNRGAMDILTYFSSIRQYVVVSIDGRGSGNRGWKVKSPMYLNLGGPEIDDQLEAMKILLRKYSFLDAARVASFGWSYGGFASAHMAERDAGRTIKCAISVAPVSDFRFYDSAFTERYMLREVDNAPGYARNTLLNVSKVENFRNVPFLLAHGEADDNVHYQNSALLAKLLQEKNIHFKQLVYTNQDHSIPATRQHLYGEMDQFLFNDCFRLNYY